MRRRQIACASSHSIVVSDKGVVYCWGSVEKGSASSGKSDLAAAAGAIEVVPATEIDPKKKDLANVKQFAVEHNPLVPRVDSVGCEERANVLVLKNGGLEEWRDGKKNILWNIENISGSLWMPKAVFVSCGAHHSLVIDDSGRLYSWGSNAHGELGLGDMQDRSAPTLVSALESVIVSRAAGGGKHSLCCTQEGDVYAFGFNEKGQLGTGNQIGQSTPTLVTGIQKTIKDVECGASHSAALSEDGRLYLFGAGTYGRCGHGYDADVYYPVENETLSRIGAVAMCSLGEVHSACVTETGRLFVWGSGMYNKLGLGEDVENKFFPTEVKSAPGLFSSVACGSSHTIAILLKDGKVVSWGLHSPNGRLGRPLNTDPTRPLPVEGIPKEETVGKFQSTDNASSLVASENLTIPTSISRSHMVKQIAVGGFHSIILTSQGTAFAFGSNAHGQCGIPHGKEFENSSHNGDPAKMSESQVFKVPQRVNVSEGSVNHKLAFVACGSNHSLVVTMRGAIFAFGNGSNHQLGLGVVSDKFIPTFVEALEGTRVDYVAGGETHSACVTREGSLYTWGSTEFGKLGLGRREESHIPYPALVHIPLELGDQVKSVSCASGHTLVVTAKGKLFSFGAGFYGRLGTGKTRNENEPTLVTFDGEDVNVLDASAGDLHSVCVTRQGDLYVWGIGDARLGLGETSDKLVPTKNPKCVSGGACIKAVASDSHTLVLTSDGTVWSFGKNVFGKLGHGSDMRDSSSPERIKPEIMQLGSAPDSILDIDNRSLAARFNHCLALSRDGRVYCWGAAGQGRLGLHAGFGVNEIGSPRRLDEINDDDGAGVENDGVGMVSGSVMETCLQAIADFKQAVAKLDAESEARLAGQAQAVSWKEIKIPIGSIQFFVKARYRQHFSDQALKQQLKACNDWEAVNLHHLREFAQNQGEVNNIEMTIAFAVQHIARAVGRSTYATVASTPTSLLKGRSSSARASSSSAAKDGRRSRRMSLGPSTTTTSTSNLDEPSERLRRSTTSLAENEIILTQHLEASLPFLERILSLLLINPGLVYVIYQRLVLSKNNIISERNSIKWSDLFVGLCRDLYPLNDIHASRLFRRLCITVAQSEINMAKSFALYGADFQRKSTFSRMFELFLLNQPHLSTIIKRKLRAEFMASKHLSPIDLNSDSFRRSMAIWQARTLDKSGGNDTVVIDKSIRDLSEVAVKIFGVFESIMSEVVFQEPSGMGQLCFEYYALLLNKFMTDGDQAGRTRQQRNGKIGYEQGAQNQIALFVARFLFHALFEPVLKEPSNYGLDDPAESVGDFPDVATREAISKFLIHALTTSSYARHANGTTSANFEASVATYQNLIRSTLILKDRQELDAKLVEARADVFKQQIFEAAVEEHRQKMMRDGAAGDSVFAYAGGTTGRSSSERRFTGLAANYIQASFEALEDIFRPLREQGIKLIRSELKRKASLFMDLETVDVDGVDEPGLARLARDALDVNILIDLANEHLRFPRPNHTSAQANNATWIRRALVVRPTRRTLEFVKYVIFPQNQDVDIMAAEPSIHGGFVNGSADGESSSPSPPVAKVSLSEDRAIFSSQGEWFVLQQLVKEYETEYGESFRLKNFEMKVHELNDSWGIALTLDLRRLDLNWTSVSAIRIITSQSDSFDRLQDLTRLDSLTNTPIPSQLVRDKDVRRDVLGLEKIASTVNSDALALRDVLCFLDKMTLDDTDTEKFQRLVDAESNKPDAPESVKTFRDCLPGGEDLLRLFAHMLEAVEERERAMAMLCSLRRAHEALKENITMALGELDIVKQSLQAYAIVLRDRDNSRNRRQVEEIAKRKGRAYKLTDLDFIRAIQSRGIVQSKVATNQARHSSFSFASCLGMFNPLPVVDERAEILAQKRLFSSHHLVKGAFVTLKYQQLVDAEIIVDIDKKPFGELHGPTEMCPTIAMNTKNAGFVVGDCALGDEYLARHWKAITRKLFFNFMLSVNGKFTISIVFNSVTVIAHVEDHISSLVTRSRSFSLDWHPGSQFPVKFRVQKLLGFVQEMSLQSFM